MQLPEMISLGGTAVTLIAMFVSIRQAKNALRDSRTAASAVSKVRLAVNAERLKIAQQHIRSLPSFESERRGADIVPLVRQIHQEFDGALGALSMEGTGGEARQLVIKAQASLNEYEASLTGTVSRPALLRLRSYVQDAISKLTTFVSDTGASA